MLLMTPESIRVERCELRPEAIETRGRENYDPGRRSFHAWLFARRQMLEIDGAPKNRE